MSNLTISFFGVKRQYNVLRQEILDITDEVLRSGQVMSGNYTAEFENWLARRNHTKYAITCHSGTQALEFMAAYFREQHTYQPRVAIPTLTYAATANAFMRASWDVVFMDTDQFGIARVNTLDVSDPPDAVVLIGLYGAAIENPFYNRGWVERLVLKDMVVLEDAAQHWLSNNCQRLGHSAAISFDPTKNFNCYGNGGAIVTDHSDMLHFARECRDNGKPNHNTTGTNSRMSEIDCAQLMVKSRYIDDWQRRRREIASYWITRLKGSAARALIDIHNFDSHCFHKFVIETDHRDDLQRFLAERRIETRIHYSQPLHEQGVFRQWPGPDMLSTASALSRRILSLPIYPELTDLEVEYIIDSVLDFFVAKHS